MLKIIFKKSIFISGAIGILLITSCSKTVYTSVALNKPFHADGVADEWENPLNYYDLKSKLQYAIANDDTTLYICIKAADDQTQMKMMLGGMYVYLDSKGKKNTTTFINFPMAHQQRITGNQLTGHGQRPEISKLKREYATDMKEMSLNGFIAPVPVGITIAKNSFGINTALAWDNNGILVYEAAIPFKTFFKSELTAHDTLQPLSIGIKLNGMQIPERENNFSHQSGGRGGGMHSGGQGGNRQANTRENGNSDRTEMSEPNDIWLALKLSFK